MPSLRRLRKITGHATNENGMFRKIVWATDGSGSADHALSYAKSLAA